MSLAHAKTTKIAALLAFGLAVGAPAAFAKKKSLKAHVHGKAKVSIAVDGTDVAVDLDTPGDGVFGFEHQPKTDAEKATVQKALDTLKTRQTEVIVFAADKGCVATDTSVETESEHAGHSDLEIKYRFKCKASPAGSEVTIGLLDLFPRIKELDVETISGTSQNAATVKSAKDAVKL